MDEDNDVIDINKFKQRKLHKRVVKDIDCVLNVLGKTKKALSYFSYYSDVKNLCIVIDSYVDRLETHRKKYAKDSS